MTPSSAQRKVIPSCGPYALNITLHLSRPAVFPKVVNINWPSRESKPSLYFGCASVCVEASLHRRYRYPVTEYLHTAIPLSPPRRRIPGCNVCSHVGSSSMVRSFPGVLKLSLCARPPWFSCSATCLAEEPDKFDKDFNDSESEDEDDSGEQENALRKNERAAKVR